MPTSGLNLVLTSRVNDSAMSSSRVKTVLHPVWTSLILLVWAYLVLTSRVKDILTCSLDISGSYL